MNTHEELQQTLDKTISRRKLLRLGGGVALGAGLAVTGLGNLTGVSAASSLTVPYVHQVLDTRYNNFANGVNACGPTSAVMALAAYGKLAARGEGFGWYVSGTYSTNGKTFNGGAWNSCTSNGGTDKDRLQQYLRDHGLPTTATWSNDKLPFIKDAINSNKLVILATKPGVMTRAGHVMVVSGYTPDGGIIVQDPYGNYRAGGWGTSRNGANVTYYPNNPSNLFNGWYALRVDVPIQVAPPAPSSKIIVAQSSYVAKGAWANYEFITEPGTYEIKLKPVNSDIDLYLFTNGWQQLARSTKGGTLEEFIRWTPNFSAKLRAAAYGYEAGNFGISIVLIR